MQWKQQFLPEKVKETHSSWTAFSSCLSTQVEWVPYTKYSVYLARLFSTTTWAWRPLYLWLIAEALSSDLPQQFLKSISCIFNNSTKPKKMSFSDCYFAIFRFSAPFLKTREALCWSVTLLILHSSARKERKSYWNIGYISLCSEETDNARHQTFVE